MENQELCVCREDCSCPGVSRNDCRCGNAFASNEHGTCVGDSGCANSFLEKIIDSFSGLPISL